MLVKLGPWISPKTTLISGIKSLTGKGLLILSFFSIIKLVSGVALLICCYGKFGSDCYVEGSFTSAPLFPSSGFGEGVSFLSKNKANICSAFADFSRIISSSISRSCTFYFSFFY